MQEIVMLTLGLFVIVTLSVVAVLLRIRQIRNRPKPELSARDKFILTDGWDEGSFQKMIEDIGKKEGL